MIDVFISYSRKNSDFTKKLVDDLKTLGKDVWFDMNDEPLFGLAPTLPWWEEIKHGIESADNFLIVLSPQSMASPYCHTEIAHAIKHEKRIVPLIYCPNGSQKDTINEINEAINTINEEEVVPESVSADISNFRDLARRNSQEIFALQFLPYLNDPDWNQWLRGVIDAVDLDIQWIRMWTQFRQAVQIWVESDYDQYELWSERRLKPVREAIAKRGQELTTDQENFLLPEQERLLRELESLPKDATSHERRRDIGDRLAVIGDTRKGVGVINGLPDIAWLAIEGGQFNAKIDKVNNQNFLTTLKVLDDGDLLFEVKPFYISKYLVTYSQYQAFVESDYDNQQWWIEFPLGYQSELLRKQRTRIANAPRDNISWYQSVAFSRWLDAQMRDAGLLPNFDMKIRLPTEQEWQWVAMNGMENHDYPWGDWQEGYANTGESGLSRSTAVGMYPHGQACSGTLDLSGNVLEWCLNNYYNITSFDKFEGLKTFRGGDFNTWHLASSTSYRSAYEANHGDPIYDSFGFRLVLSPILHP